MTRFIAIAGVAVVSLIALAGAAPAQHPALTADRTMLEMTFPEFEEAVAASDVALVPIGTIEEHGPHLPLGSDAIGAVGQLASVRDYLQHARRRGDRRAAASATIGKTIVEDRTRLIGDDILQVLKRPTNEAAPAAQPESPEAAVRRTVEAFYATFNSHAFDRVAEFTTDDWNHINPFGGRTRGREAVLKELHEVHSTFLKGVTDTVDQMDIRFATPDVALATVTSHVSTFTTPDGVTYANEHLIRTFVVVRRGDRWLIMQDQNTMVR